MLSASMIITFISFGIWDAGWSMITAAKNSVAKIQIQSGQSSGQKLVGKLKKPGHKKRVFALSVSEIDSVP